jgi:hypothetical protein
MMGWSEGRRGEGRDEGREEGREKRKPELLCKSMVLMRIEVLGNNGRLYE